METNNKRKHITDNISSDEYEYEIFIAQISQGYIEVHKYIQ